MKKKEAHDGFPKRIYDTLSSFSNQNEGGIILFGITDKPDFNIVGVYDPENVQRKITEACNQMEPPVRAVLTICAINGKIVVSAEIPGVEHSLRPVFYKGRGRLRGSFVRVGDVDEPMTEYEVYSYEAFRKRTRDDTRLVERAKLELFDQERLAAFLKAAREEPYSNLSDVPDADVLELMGVTSDGTLRNKAVMSNVSVYSITQYSCPFYLTISSKVIQISFLKRAKS